MTFYLLWFFLTFPWLMLTLGAAFRLRYHDSKPVRFQALGAVMIVILMAVMLIVFTPYWGLDPDGTKNVLFQYDRLETGFYWIGLIVFFLGYFLERRPDKPAEPWPLIGKSIALIIILAAAVAAVPVYRLFELPWENMPWSSARLVLTLGFYPFSTGYVAYSIFRATRKNTDFDEGIESIL